MVIKVKMEGPLSLKETLDGIDKLLNEKNGKGLPGTLAAAIIRNAENAKISEDDVSTLDNKIKTFRANNKVRLIETDVPFGILPFGYSAVLADAKVNAKGPDDLVYRKNPEIRNLIPRGLTFIRLSGQEKKFDTILYANKKFTGGVGDEDDRQPENDDIWREYCLAPPESAEQIICMEKLNGEAAHFSGRYIGGNFYLITGSKNVHMLIKNQNEIDLYEGGRYEVAKVVARAVSEAIDRLNPSARHLICSLLHHTKCTVLSEVLQPDHQHIVNLSALERPEINIIMFTPTFVDNNESSLTAFPPHHALDMMSAIGFACAPYTKIQPENLLEHKEKVRNKLNTEGEVLYFVNKEDETIGIAKMKTCWYVVLRALREQAVNSFTSAKKNNDWNLQERIKKAHKRLLDIQRFLHFSDNYLERWQKLYARFICWLNKEINSNREVGVNIRPDFPCIWRRFLNQENQTDNFVS